jgi:single-strand DNA-binding protein
MNEVKGTIKAIKKTQVISEKYRKREFVLTTEDKYPQDVLFQLSQDNCDLVDIFKEGDKVTLAYNLRGIEWVSPKGETKYFNTLEVWKMNYQDETMKPAVKEEEVQEVNQSDSLPF